MRVGLDDTDSPQGGCTTRLLLDLLDAAAPRLGLAGPPRLVRLNPNVPHKTRGNGAVRLDLVEPAGRSAVVGEHRGLPVHAWPEGRPARATQGLLDRLWSAVEAGAEPDAEPGLVLLDAPPDPSFYWAAVQGWVEAAQPPPDALHRSRGRGLVGAMAAAAWPGPPSSHELVAYREPARIGSPREVRAEPLASLDGSATFHSFDAAAGRLACVPNTPCPVLAGLRGRDPARLVAQGLPALRRACREPVASWLLWATNHASGDHVVPVARLADAPAWSTVQAAASVLAKPERRAGGHLFVACTDAAGARFEAVAFEPTKGLRDTVGTLRPGDRVLLVGAWRDGVLRLEKLKVDSLEPWPVKLANPACPGCGRSMKSAGAGAGYRCRRCRTQAPQEAAGVRTEERPILGWHEVPVAARRHLHRPVAWDGDTAGPTAA